MLTSCAAAALCGAHPAAAAEVHVAPAPAPRFPCCSHGSYSQIDQAVYYTAADGESNSFTATAAVGESSDLEITVHDDGATIEPGDGCTLIDEHTARCATDSNLDHVEASLGDGDDVLHQGPPDPFAPTITAFGGPGDDQLEGGLHRDELYGGGGTDTLEGHGDNDVLSDGDPSDADDRDVLDGGRGEDLVSYAERTGPVTVDLRVETGGHDILHRIEDVTGGSGDDRLTGNGRRNELRGGQGDDTLLSAGGDDLLVGGFGTDRLEAGDGDDVLDPGARTDSFSCGLGQDEVLRPGPGEVIGRCEEIVFDGLDGGGDLNLLALPPHPFATTKRHVDFELPCPEFDADAGAHAPCAGKVALREAFGKRRPLGPTVRVRARRRGDTVRVRLNFLGRRLISRLRGVFATISLHGDATRDQPRPLPNVAWSVRLRH